MTYGIMDALIPCEPLNLDLGTPRVVSFDDRDDAADDRLVISKKERARLLDYRVTKITKSFKPDDGFIPCATLCRRTGMNASVVARILSYLQSHGKVESKQAGDRHVWRKV